MKKLIKYWKPKSLAVEDKPGKLLIKAEDVSQGGNSVKNLTITKPTFQTTI